MRKFLAALMAVFMLMLFFAGLPVSAYVPDIGEGTSILALEKTGDMTSPGWFPDDLWVPKENLPVDLSEEFPDLPQFKQSEWTYFEEEGKYYRYKTKEGDRNNCIEVTQEEHDAVLGIHREQATEDESYILLNVGVSVAFFCAGALTVFLVMTFAAKKKSANEGEFESKE